MLTGQWCNVKDTCVGFLVCTWNGVGMVLGYFVGGSDGVVVFESDVIVRGCDAFKLGVLVGVINGVVGFGYDVRVRGGNA